MMERTLGFGIRLFWAALMLALRQTLAAQEFSVASVEQMKYDVSAFVEPVRDLNGDACALIRVEGPSDFAFSTPLGIVKRRDDVGEVLLYVPPGTQRLTIKHPEWGVLRNYPFREPLESRMCYVMKLRLPGREPLTVRDTVVVTRTLLDTVRVSVAPPPRRWKLTAMLTSAFGRTGPQFGAMVALQRRHGFFLHVRTDFRSVGDVRCEVDRNGIVAGSQLPAYFSGTADHSAFVATAGMIHRLSGMFSVYEGIGYGEVVTAWGLTGLSGSGNAVVTDHTHKGIAGELGVVCHVGRMALMASASTVKGREWQLNVGVGIGFD